MISNTRAIEDFHGVGNPSSFPSEAPPKRSKLDFLAMIAEMSEKTDAEPTMAAMPAVAVAMAQTAETVPPPVVEAAPIEKPPVKSESKKPIKKSSKADGPKSSFAAWKLAKGRKGSGSKSPSRKEISLGRANKNKEIPASMAPPSTAEVPPSVAARMDVVVTPTSPVKEAPAEVSMADVMQRAIEMKALAAAAAAAQAPPQPAVIEASPMAISAPMDALAVAAASKEQEMMAAAAAAPSLPPKKALKHKDGKKSSSPKKAGTSIKKDKDGMSAKKASKKKDKDGSGKVKSSSKSKTKKIEQPSPKATPSFPEKIMELLQKNMASNAIYWLPEGEAIAVDPDNFKDSTVISKQFRGNKLSSFVRSLNRWGFRRIFYHSLPDKTLAFYHRLFQKQTPLLVKEMKMDGGEKEPALPAATAAPVAMAVESAKPPAVIAEPEPPKPEESPVVSARAMVGTPVVVESEPASPAVAAPSPAAAAAAALLSAQVNAQAAAAAVAAPPEPAAAPSAAAIAAAAAQEQAVRAALSAAQPDLAQSMLERASNLELVEGQNALQQAMIAEQERSDLALQQLQAQQVLLQSLAEQQSAAQAEELLMQSMIAEQQRSDLALQQHQAEQALVQQMLAEEQSAALAAALGGTGSLSAEALLRERLLAQELAARAPAPGSDVLALLQQQAQGAQPAREASYMEQLILLEQQQRQRQEEAALLAARGFRF